MTRKRTVRVCLRVSVGEVMGCIHMSDVSIDFLWREFWLEVMLTAA